MAPPLKDDASASSSHEASAARPSAAPPSSTRETRTVAPSSSGSEVDVDDLADSRRSQALVNALVEEDKAAEERDLMAIVTELNQIDLEKEHTAQRRLNERTHTRHNPSPPGTHSVDGAASSRARAAASLHKESPGVCLPAQPLSATRECKEKGKTERDAAAEEDEEINPVLLRHLAEELQPGAFPSNARPPNLAVGQTQEASTDSLPTSSAVNLLHSSENTNPTRTPLSGPTEQATDPTLNESTNTDSAPLAPQQEEDLIEASLVSQPGISLTNFSNHSSDPENDLERPPTPNQRAPQDNDTPQDTNEVVEAEDAKFSDFLQNRTFCLFLVGYLCAIVTIAILVVVIIVLQRENANNKSFSYNPKHVQDAKVILDTAGEILAEYIDPVYNPVQFNAFQWLNSNPNLEELPHWRKVQLYGYAAFYFALSYQNWPQVDKAYLLYEGVHECQWNKRYAINPCGEDGLLQQLLLIGNGTEGWKYTVGGVRGHLPGEVAMLRSLNTIRIEYTDLNANLGDMLPPQLETLVNLTTLHYGSNRLQSTIPTRIARLNGLTFLSLQSNQLTSYIPSELGSMTRLTSLRLDSNHLGGAIPLQLANLAGNLTHLSLRNNILLGPVPTQISQLQQLTSLNLQQNWFAHAIMTEIGLLTNLEILQLWGNQFTGPIPSQLGLLTNLKFLDLHGNQFSGLLPTQLGLLTRLERLLVHDNDGVNGAVPDALCHIGSLGRFEVNCLHVDCEPKSCTCSCYRF